MKKRILCLSNGHGEDGIAVAILRALAEYPVELMAMPIVGTGGAYEALDIPIIGPTRTMPSGGFIYMDPLQLWRDIQEGLGRLTWAQYQAIKAVAPEVDLILAVGDIVVQIFAQLSKKPHVFVGTAKSDYYIGGKPSVYAPWERWLMLHPRCTAVYPRDRVTTLNLQKLGIPRAYDLGNPMMDGLTPQGFDWARVGLTPAHRLVALLPGSRPPEAYRNLILLLTAVEHLGEQPFPLVAMAALTNGLKCPELVASLEQAGWSYSEHAPDLVHLCRGQHQVYLVWGAFADCITKASLVLAMTGTATEQAVGLGKPVVTLPGAGPQFNHRFAEAQTRLLGPSVTLLQHPQDIAPTACNLLTDHTYLAQLQANGRERMGTIGAAGRIAQHVMAQ
ncbi:lipid-A-disaccharide synthase-related protein [Anthocerotibacter panamensis]|uniref:lipid-A-disaccharide synthase-related protein n=1 Tax=Anthocerotibacter panamensis TaxID=2857077 RepID=UPI001C401AE8|nr:lipid-A-disaccharide synthase-related protein [Anthocerotibacter panamensis]